VLLAAGAAGLATGSVAGILAIQSKHKLDEACGEGGDHCPSSFMSEHDRLNRWADVSTVAFSVGAVAIGVSTVLLLSTGARPSSTTAGPTGTNGLVIRPAIGYGSAFLTGSF
jgi:hypothetical protein